MVFFRNSLSLTNRPTPLSSSSLKPVFLLNSQLPRLRHLRARNLHCNKSSPSLRQYLGPLSPCSSSNLSTAPLPSILPTVQAAESSSPLITSQRSLVSCGRSVVRSTRGRFGPGDTCQQCVLCMIILGKILCRCIDYAGVVEQE